MAEKPFQPRALEGDVVVVVEIIDTENFVAALQQALGDGSADEILAAIENLRKELS